MITFSTKGLSKFEIDFLELFLNGADDDFRLNYLWEKGITFKSQKNAFSDYTYNGINQFYLQLLQNAFDDLGNNWATFKQAKDNGYRIRKGAKGVKIQYFTFIDKKTNKKWNEQEFNDWLKGKSQKEISERLKDKRALERYYTVFNEIDLISLKNNKTYRENNIENDISKINLNDDVESFKNNLIKNMNIEIEYLNNLDTAYYDVLNDKVVMPNINQFKNSNYYYATLIHELGHATGTHNRLSRQINNKFGSELYALEELTVELNAVFMLNYLNIKDIDINNHLVYLDSWTSIIKDNPKKIIYAIRNSLKIKDYMIDLAV